MPANRQVVCLAVLMLLSGCDTLKKSKDVFFNRFKVSTTSMSPAIEPGETYSLVTTTEFRLNQVVGYHPPKEFRFENADVVYANRLVGLPGDTLEMKNGELFLNKKIYPIKLSLKHAYTVVASAIINERHLEGLELVDRYHKESDVIYLFFATPAEISSLKKISVVKEARSEILNADGGGETVSMKISALNRDNWGPLILPRKGQRIRLTTKNYKAYENMLPPGKEFPTETEVTSTEDYYFVLGDNRHNALDSRYTGLIPQHEMVGVLVGAEQ
jgi:signal peptidase I